MNKYLPNDYKYIKWRKKLKYTKQKEIKHIELKIGNLGLKAIKSGYVTANMLEIIRRTVARKLKKQGKMLIFVHTNIPKTKKSSGMRMGKGKGSLDVWLIPIKQGKIFIELVGVPLSIGMLILKMISFKLPMKTKIITKP